MAVVVLSGGGPGGGLPPTAVPAAIKPRLLGGFPAQGEPLDPGVADIGDADCAAAVHGHAGRVRELAEVDAHAAARLREMRERYAAYIARAQRRAPP